jgi:hypothetical protein
VGIVAYLLFFLAGLGFGYAAPGRLKCLPFAFPIVLALGALIKNGIDAALILRLLLALVITAAGIIVGREIDERARRREAAAT